VGPNPLIKVTATKAKMEALISNTIIGSPLRRLGQTPRNLIVIAPLPSVNTTFCLPSGVAMLHYSTGTFAANLD
jgi:hypothetical protein